MIIRLEVQQKTKSIKLRLDNEGEFTSGALKKWCKDRGLELDYSIPYCPELNGTSERKNLTIMTKARAMIQDSGVGKQLWGEAVLAATYLMNRSPKRGMNETPFEK